MQNLPRQYTEQETRTKFLKNVWDILEYWHNLPDKTEQKKMSGAAFSILSMIDGCNVSICGFLLAPNPHPDAKEFRTNRGLKHYAENHEVDISCNIAGTLHESFYNYQPEDWE